ncbi:hypothetical protein FEE95_02635 [Maribacter algarum]|uniref:Uncharacterized protein n=1 Tax=Maribacter algarum (ex Zhang et al. 2020) TaxID=2578118 RepID=A0A5S3PTN7_9FLAO|nr:hypothetical protein [Maribacter algarum]TMM58345.1 hypothetical protein FEE95_02635 [Maribacter algarum]
MLQDLSDSTALFQTAQKEKLYDKLVSQLQKDFALANIDIDLSSEVEPDVLKTLLHEKIYFLILEKFTEYLNLLYIIDVPEKAFKKIHMTDAVEVAEQVTFLVLKRELQKVWLKAKYS